MKCLAHSGPIYDFTTLVSLAIVLLLSAGSALGCSLWPPS